MVWLFRDTGRSFWEVVRLDLVMEVVTWYWDVVAKVVEEMQVTSEVTEFDLTVEVLES